YAYAEGKRYAGMLNIGHRPTVDNGTERSIEAHIIGFEGNLYQHYLRIDFLSFIRKEQKFSNLKELIGQLQKDKEYIQMLYQ
ncbi:MAG TPA: riboflavin kinase, partial [Candidatus Phocaeicola gallistercoris]|nr:riboflavin kinase [Candidatus Phocaeicola gallistercoris]